jgi:hypothetical protein
MKRSKLTEHKKGHFSSGGPLVLKQSAQSRQAMSKSVRRHNSVKRMAAVALDWRKAG